MIKLFLGLINQCLRGSANGSQCQKKEKTTAKNKPDQATDIDFDIENEEESRRSTRFSFKFLFSFPFYP